jgi:hypothetical protein
MINEEIHEKEITLKDLAAMITHVDHRFDELEGIVVGGFDRTHEQLEDVRAELKEFDSKFDFLQEDVQRLDKMLETRVKRLEARP